jgi:hypothetical protein
VPFASFCQNVVEGRWSLEAGASLISSPYRHFTVINLRYISPRFRWSHEDWTAEEEKHPERYKKTRFMMEVLYASPLTFLGTSLNIQYRFIKYKKFSVEAYGGLKFIIFKPSDYVINPHSSGNKKEIWYLNPGLIFQFDLGLIGPFADIGGDGILTVGTELDIYRVYKKLKKNFSSPYLNEK